MSQSISPQNPIQPLSVGNVVSAGFKLYRSHLKLYFGIALISVLWILLPLLGLIFIGAAGGIIAGVGNQPVVAGLVILLVVLAAIPVMVYSSAKSALNSALIARLAFGELVEQPEGAKAARSQLKPRMWGLWFAGFLIALIAIAFSIVNQIVQLAAVGGADNPFVGLLVFLLILASFTVQAWINCRLFIYDVPLAIENEVRGGSESLGRSWDLTKGNALRIFLISLVTFLITLPIFLLLFVIAGILAIPLIQSTLPSAPPSAQFAPLILFLIFGVYGLILVGLLFVIPLWQAIKAVVYYDLRSRREGMGLQIRDRDSFNQ